MEENKMEKNNTILNLIKKYEEEAVEIRHYLHKHPEVSNQEFTTSTYLKNYLKDLDFIIEDVESDEISSGTGFTATFDTGKPGKTIGLRTDIDALPMKENKKNLKKERTIISKNPDAMHACAHDGHMSTVLITAKILLELKESLQGKIILIFEEGEENSTGIHAMVRHLEDKNIDAIYGNHLASFLDVGQISADPGPVMAASAAVDFDVIGKGGHGSRPDLSINPLFVGTDILNSISVAWNNQLDVEETVTLGLTKFQVGEALNVIDDRANIGGTLRYFNVEEGLKGYDMLMNIAEKVASVHQASIYTKKNAGPLTIPVINDEELCEVYQTGVEELFPGSLTHGVNWFASESFAYYRKVAPTLFSFIGIRNKDLGSGAEHHNEYFDMDDASLEYSIGMMVKFVVDFLQ